MNNWIDSRIEKAGWLRFLFWLGVTIAYSLWAFLAPGPWTRMLGAMGAPGETALPPGLPETSFGFPAEMPASAFEKLAPIANDYVLFQLIDLPYAFISMMMVSAGIGLGLKRFNLGGSIVRFALLLPLIYLAAELVENPLLAAMALGALPAEGAAAAMQQTATTVKFLADGAGSTALAVSIIASLAALITKPFRRGGRKEQAANS